MIPASMPKTAVPKSMNINEITKMPARFKKNPILAISKTRTRLLPNIIAFGGVATGIMNAQDAASVAGIISIKG